MFGHQRRNFKTTENELLWDVQIKACYEKHNLQSFVIDLTLL